jgi:hypothetical protein
MRWIIWIQILLRSFFVTLFAAAVSGIRMARADGNPG